MRYLNDVSPAGRWWPDLVTGYMFHRNTGTDPHPLLKINIKINAKTLDLDSPEETLLTSANIFYKFIY